MRPLFVFAAVLPLVAAPLPAQDAPSRVGLGIIFASAGPGASTAIQVPIALSPRRRLEPEIGFSHISSTLDLGGSPRETKTVSIIVGAGLFFLTGAGENAKVYFGPRLGIVFASMRVTDPSLGSSESENTDWFLSVAGGGEYFLSPRFSLGAEARLGYYHGGQPTGSGGGIASSSQRFGTGAAALLRWYL